MHTHTRTHRYTHIHTDGEARDSGGRLLCCQCRRLSIAPASHGHHQPERPRTHWLHSTAEATCQRDAEGLRLQKLRVFMKHAVQRDLMVTGLVCREAEAKSYQRYPLISKLRLRERKVTCGELSHDKLFFLSQNDL